MKHQVSLLRQLVDKAAAHDIGNGERVKDVSSAVTTMQGVSVPGKCLEDT